MESASRQVLLYSKFVSDTYAQPTHESRAAPPKGHITVVQRSRVAWSDRQGNTAKGPHYGCGRVDPRIGTPIQQRVRTLAIRVDFRFPSWTDTPGRAARRCIVQELHDSTAVKCLTGHAVVDDLLSAQCNSMLPFIKVPFVDYVSPFLPFLARVLEWRFSADATATNSVVPGSSCEGGGTSSRELRGVWWCSHRDGQGARLGAGAPGVRFPAYLRVGQSELWYVTA